MHSSLSPVCKNSLVLRMCTDLVVSLLQLRVIDIKETFIINSILEPPGNLETLIVG